MPVSGLVVTFSDDTDARENAIKAIQSDSRIELGVTQSQRAAIVVDTTSDEEDKQLWKWLNELPGVIFVDVVMVGFEEQSSTSDER